jgi:hypothetical protein
MATMTSQLGAVSSTLRVRNFEQNTLPLELVFQDGRVMSPDEAKYPEKWRNVSLGEQRFKLSLNQPSAITRPLDPHSQMPDGQRSYLLGLGVKTILIISLTSRGQVNGRLRVLVFYDTTKNHRRQWCSNSTCGNRHKVAEFRRRQRTAGRKQRF